MELTLEPPIHILPGFRQIGQDDHGKLAESLGFVFGPTARFAKANKDEPDHILMQVPKRWKESSDAFGQYLLDEKNRRRVRFGNINKRFFPQSELLNRFAIQDWSNGDGTWTVYVRKIIGGEENIYQYGSCQVIKKTEKVVVNSEHRYAGSQNSSGSSFCKEWLDRNFPDWEDPIAYWDIE